MLYSVDCSVELTFSAMQERDHHSGGLKIQDVLDALQQLLAQLQVRCYSTYHTCAAIADIAHAGLDVQSSGTPYFSSIEALARKEDEHAALVSDLFATCEQLIVELRTAVACVESAERETIPECYDGHS